jgi:hypothetical protein
MKKFYGGFFEIDKDVGDHNRPLDDRIRYKVTPFLKKSGTYDRDILMAYFEEISVLAIATRSSENAHALLCDLACHTSKIMHKISESAPLTQLEKLPEGTMKNDPILQYELNQNIKDVPEKIENWHIEAPEEE